MKKILPIGQSPASIELLEEVSSILMDFVSHNQKPFSKSLQRFMARGGHDLRAGGVALDILVKVQKYLDEADKP